MPPVGECRFPLPDRPSTARLRQVAGLQLLYGFALRPTAPPRGGGGAARRRRSRPRRRRASSGTRTASAMRATPALTSRTRTASCAASPGVHDPPPGTAACLRATPVTSTPTVAKSARLRTASKLALVALQRAAVVGDARAQAADLLGGRRLGQRAQQAAALGARLGQARGGAVVGVGDVVGALLQRLDVAEPAQPRQRVVEAAGRDAQDERRGRVPVAGGDLRGLHEAARRPVWPARRRRWPSARRWWSAPGACCARRGAGGRAVRSGRRRPEPRAAGLLALPLPALPLPALALRRVRRLLLGGRRRATPAPLLLPAPSFDPPPALSTTTATMAARTQPATPSAGTIGRSDAKRRRGSARSKPRSTRMSRRARKSGAIAGASARTSRTSAASSGSAAGSPARAASSASSSAATAGSRVGSRRRMTGLSKSGRGRGARGCPRWRPRRRGRRRSRRC